MICFKSKSILQTGILVGLAVLLSLQTGCSGGYADFTYGKAGDSSVNGVSVFANVLRQRGHSVSRKLRLTKRLDKYQTIVWAPDNINGPPEDVAAWVEQWLVSDTTRVLIYIGRSYDGKLPFHRSMAAAAPAEERENWQRKMNELVLADAAYNDWGFFEIPWEPYWFKKETNLRLDSSKLGGPWASNVDPAKIELDCQTLLLPPEKLNDSDAAPVAKVKDEETGELVDDDWNSTFRDQQLKVKNLLTVDGKPFAYQIYSAAYPKQKLIVVSNGSFLLNFPLTNPEHRKLASEVADEVQGDVVFVESGFRWPTVGGGANDPALRWTWVGQAPMNYIVPHFLFWGVLYCFVFYPNFGRPKRVEFHPPKAFRSHVKAVASILGRSKEQSWARQVVDMWLKRNNKTKG